MSATPQPAETYYRNLEDARRLQWQKVIDAGYVVHLGQVYIGATLNPRSGIWMLSRVQWCDDCSQFELVQTQLLKNEAPLHIPAHPQYICADILGLPDVVGLS